MEEIEEMKKRNNFQIRMLKSLYIESNLPSYPKVSVKFLHLTLGGSAKRNKKKIFAKFSHYTGNIRGYANGKSILLRGKIKIYIHSI